MDTVRLQGIECSPLASESAGPQLSFWLFQVEEEKEPSETPSHEDDVPDVKVPSPQKSPVS